MYEELEGKDLKEWVGVYNTSKLIVPPLVAKEISDNHIKRLREQRAEGLKAVDFAIERSQGEILICDEAGEYYFDAVLIGEDTHKDGTRIDEKVLQEWTNYINDNGLVADIDHSTIKDLIRRGKSHDYIKTYMRNKPGIAKAVKAFYENGELRIRAWIDKRYRRMVDRIKGLSLESLVDYDKEDPNLVVGGDIFGFTLNVDTEPAYANAKVI